MMWFFVGLYALNILFQILMIGKPRQPITPGSAALGSVISAIYIVLLLMFWGS